MLRSRVLRRANRTKLQSATSRMPPPDPLGDALVALRNAVGDFLVGEAQRYELPVSLVRPDGSTQDGDERAAQCEAIDRTTGVLIDTITKGLVESAPPAVRLAILASQRGLKKKLDAEAESPAVANGESQ